MKAKSTIKKQIARLTKVCDHTKDKKIGGEAYEAYHALRWVVEDTSWTPAKLFEDRLSGEKH